MDLSVSLLFFFKLFLIKHLHFYPVMNSVYVCPKGTIRPARSFFNAPSSALKKDRRRFKTKERHYCHCLFIANARADARDVIHNAIIVMED